MSRNPSQSAPADNTSRAASSVETPKPSAPRPAPKGDQYWFVFDRWLPQAPRPEDEFILA